jgi:hypothetical protein
MFFARPRRLAKIDEEPDAEHYLARTIFEIDPEPYDTGLIDPIMAAIVTEPIGFIRWPSK